MIFSPISFTCASCGAPQKFSPKEGMLICEFCSTSVLIENSTEQIKEYDFHKAISTLNLKDNIVIEKEIKCSKCAARFTVTPYSFSSSCPYCDTPAIIEFVKEIVPKSLLPFIVTQKDGKAFFKKWVGSRWFAPNSFTEHLNNSNKLQGYYLPYWTYDSNTTTQYNGLRGDTYYVTVTKRVVQNGVQRDIQVQEARINWVPVSGVVYVSFDDVTIGASRSISRAILNAIEPWDSQNLIPYNEQYLTGFEAEEYTIGLDNGFEMAKVKMSHIISLNIKQDIGGDHQRVQESETQYKDLTYKNTLFPVWIDSFKWRDKVYNYAINGRTGKISGERPYSVVKIVFTVLFVSIVFGVGYYIQNR